MEVTCTSILTKKQKKKSLKTYKRKNSACEIDSFSSSVFEEVNPRMREVDIPHPSFRYFGRLTNVVGIEPRLE